ncbi:MAG: hypothetical protein ACP5G1_02820 [Nanopusillaceae archaeon]
MPDQPTFFYAGLYRFGKGRSKILLDRNKLIILTIATALTIYSLNLLISCGLL